MRITDLHLPPPACLGTVRTTRAEGDFRTRFLSNFVTDEEEAHSLARHRSWNRPEEDWVSTREESEVWTIGCTCGAEDGKVFGVRENDTFSAPLFYACLKCASRFLIFDLKRHGHNGEIDSKKRKRKPPSAAPKATFAMHCRACKNTVWRLAVIVTYQGEPLDLDSGQRVQDHFDVILVGGTCTTCGTIAIAYDAECA